MRYLIPVIAVTLAACQQDISTGPGDGSVPQFAATATNVSISGKGTATQLNNSTIVTEASFQCPEGELAQINVSVSQASTVMNGVGGAFENCKDGPNTVVVQVTGVGKLGWDVAKALAKFSITTKSGGDSDTKEITIHAP